ncbi:MAG: aminotransferase class V-fold PLP-dependent enzyme [Euryarchaeota archaeon]|nr:aminotransferase class V-fold PLP-dependent enzyme [Euryarchaeota archaeon]
MDFEAWRAEFPGLERKTYLNSCSLGALSRRVRAAVNLQLDLWEELGASAWYGLWMGELDALRQKLARLFSVEKSEMSVQPSVSVALGSIASSLDYTRRPAVVSADMDFPTVPYQWMVKGSLHLRMVHGDGVKVDASGFEKAMDKTVAALATSHVYFTSGFIQDVPRICRAARENGALAIIDGYQAAGQLPVSPRELGADVYIAGGLKWLLGGTGIAYMYVRNELALGLDPKHTGWFAAARQFEFDANAFEFKPDARRFEAGTPPVAAVYAASAGLDIILEIGPERIRERTARLVDGVYERLVDAGYSLKTPGRSEERAGIVMVALKDPATAVKRLAAEGIIVDSRPGRLRVSPYFYNTDAELDRFVAALKRHAPPGNG